MYIVYYFITFHYKEVDVFNIGNLRRVSLVNGPILWKAGSLDGSL